MARNKVQYQKGLSEAEFDRQYGSEGAVPRGGGQVAVAGRLRLPALRRPAAQA